MSLPPAFLHGFRSGLPAAAGLFTFGVIAGVATVGAGFPPWIAIFMTVVIYAGSSQLVAVQMLVTGTPAPVVLLANLVINLRFVLYSVSMRAHLTGLTGWRRILGSYLLSDNSYALAATRAQQRTHGDAAAERYEAAHYLGSSASVWLAWQAGGVAGVLVGARVPPEWGLEFIVVLVFLGMGVMQIRDAALAIAGVAAGTVAVLAWALPFKLGIVLAAFAGIVAGLAVERMGSRPSTP